MQAITFDNSHNIGIFVCNYLHTLDQEQQAH